ncbi:hypothetical protein D2E76_16405 [Mycobacteroides abscessus]|uniref:Uncharacterized protein n=1 Tax=Mycobacteroides abscessus TaxID=36809 RepID=A0ABD7HNJ3_9MYCO|nr:hypothetical protein [Mycobacteroides abscessus]RIT36833.1 hypothetical protein D2E76_16405 [Mycobacteroides abscessus]
MKVTVQVAADIDLDAWRSEFQFVGPDPEVVADIERYLQRITEIQLAALGLLVHPARPNLTRGHGGDNRVEILGDGRCPKTCAAAVNLEAPPVVARAQFKPHLENEDSTGEHYQTQTGGQTKENSQR